LIEETQFDAYGALFSALPMGIVVYGCDGLIREANPAARARLGLESSWPLASLAAAGWALETGATSEADIVALVLRERRTLRNRLLRCDPRALGAVERLPISFSPMAMAGVGEVACAVLGEPSVCEQGGVAGIGDCRAAGRALRESEQRYRSLFEAASEAILVSCAGRVALTNAACLALFGVGEAAQLIGRSTASLFSADSPNPTLNQLSELRIVRDDGLAIEVEVSAAAFEFRGETATHLVLRDVSLRRRQERESRLINRIEQAIGNSSRALIRARNEADFLDEICTVVVRDCGYRAVWVGMAEDDAQRSVRKVAWAGIDPEDAETVQLSWAADSPWGQGPTGQAIRSGLPSYCRDLLSDPGVGRWRAAVERLSLQSTGAFPLLADDATAFGVISIFATQPDPFSEREVAMLGMLANELSFGIRSLRVRQAHRIAEGEMVALRRELQHLVERQVASHTLAAIAHELNQPLNALTTFGEAARNLLARNDAGQLQAALDGMTGQAERAGRVLRKLMGALKQADTSRQMIDLAALTAQLVPLFNAGQAGGDLVIVKTPAEPVQAYANALHVEQVMLNLLQNGLDAMEGGSAPPLKSLLVEISRERGMAVVAITDCGPGIAAEDRRRIFDPFFTTKENGIGMGLPISRSLVESNGGTLWFASEGTGGATFFFTLPSMP
jgi:PAS domain S-box-containing protein